MVAGQGGKDLGEQANSLLSQMHETKERKQNSLHFLDWFNLGD